MEKPKTKTGECEYHLCKKKTKVLLCEYCGRYFCEEHIKPKPVLSLRQVSTIKEPLRSKLEEVWRSKKGHPDYNFTSIFWKQIEEEEKLKTQRMWEALDNLKKLKEVEGYKEPKTVESKSVETPSEFIKKVKESYRPQNKNVKIKNSLIILSAIATFIVLAWFLRNFAIQNSPEEHIVIPEQKIQITTTTLKENKQYFVDLNFSTPFTRLNKTFFINNFYSVYINDSLLKIIDPNSTGFYNRSMEAIKKAFKIWEEETKLVKFEFVETEENYTIYVEITPEMPIHTMEREFVSYAVGYTIPYGYECGNYVFIKGGKIYVSPKKELELLKITLHEIGHILNLADVGNRDSVMCKWGEEEIISEEVLRERITKEIKETLKMIIKPEYDCRV